MSNEPIANYGATNPAVVLAEEVVQSVVNNSPHGQQAAQLEQTTESVLDAVGLPPPTSHVIALTIAVLFLAFATAASAYSLASVVK